MSESIQINNETLTFDKIYRTSNYSNNLETTINIAKSQNDLNDNILIYNDSNINLIYYNSIVLYATERNTGLTNTKFSLISKNLNKIQLSPDNNVNIQWTGIWSYNNKFYNNIFLFEGYNTDGFITNYLPNELNSETIYNNCVFIMNIQPAHSFILNSYQNDNSSIVFNNCLFDFQSFNILYELFMSSSTANSYLTFNNCIFKGLVNWGRYKYPQIANTNNCIFEWDSSYTSTWFNYNNCLFNQSITYDNKYHIINTNNWENTGTGTNPDGSQAHIGVYGGPYAWGQWGVKINSINYNII